MHALPGCAHLAHELRSWQPSTNKDKICSIVARLVIKLALPRWLQTELVVFVNADSDLRLTRVQKGFQGYILDIL